MMERPESGYQVVPRRSLARGVGLPSVSSLEGEWLLFLQNKPILNIPSGRVDKPFLKAGRKHHAMKAKRNSWPKTRGVAMNPVDRMSPRALTRPITDDQIPMVVVTTNILVTLRPWHETHLPVKRLVSSPPGEPVSSGVPSTSLPPTNKRVEGFDVLVWEVSSHGRICNTYANVYTDPVMCSGGWPACKGKLSNVWQGGFMDS